MLGIRKAWVDESVRRSGVPEPMYLLGATIASKQQYEACADALRQYAPKGNKLHWRDLGRNGKRQVAETLSNLEFEHVIVVRTLLAGMGEERARGLCVQRLMWELDNRDVEQVTFESRSYSQDREDLRRIDGLRSRKEIRPQIQAEWARGRHEPLLWASDAIVGLVGDAKAGNDDWWCDLWEKITEVVL